jgi:signal peptidase I
VGAAVGLLLLTGIATALAFRLLGGSWFIVQTPSMGETAPVGSLVLAQPVGAGDLHVGDIVSFTPPTVPGQVYTHRIVGIANGAITTRGDANAGPDGWRLAPRDVVGRVGAVLPGVGWAVRALPLLAAGCALVELATRLLRSRSLRAGIRLAGFPLVVAGVTTWLHPFVGTALLTAASSAGGTDAVVVSTGLLPIRVQAHGGGFVDLTAGRVGRLHIDAASSGGHYLITSAAHLPVWGWAVLVAACSAPLVCGVVLALRRRAGAA